jgi:hypothetical protein
MTSASREGVNQTQRPQGARRIRVQRWVHFGFAVWEHRGRSSRSVTFPARQHSVNGERRSFALLRAHSDKIISASV